MGSSQLQNWTSKDMKFDHPFKNICAYDGCRIDMRYTNPKKLQVLNDNRYCSKACLDKQYKSLGIDGAIHIIHQAFGPEHPVTFQIKKMRKELAAKRKHLDLDDRKYIGKIKEARNEERANKCL